MPLPPSAPFLVHLYRQFPFAEGRLQDLTSQYASLEDIPADRWPRSFRIHLACMVSLVTSAMIPKGVNRLGFAYNANAQRSGKSLLAQSAICPVHGWTSGRTWPVGGDNKKSTDESELRKTLDSLALEGSPYCFFDNIRAQVESPALEAFMTLPVWSGRVMGGQKTFSAAIACTFIITANNLKLSVDVRERFLQCDLFVEEAEAMARDVESPIEQAWIMEHRNEIFDAVYALVDHWDRAGRPGAPGRVRKGFETFSHMIGGIIAAAGFGDLFEPRREDGNSGNSTDNDMRKLVNLLSERLLADLYTSPVPNRHFTFDEVVQTSYQHGLFTYLLEGKEESFASTGITRINLSQSSNARFGSTLKTYAPERRGRTWSLPYEGKFRLKCEGEGRQRRYVASMELPPRARLHQMMTLEEIGHQSLGAFLEANGLPPLDQIQAGDCTALIQQWAQVLHWIRSQPQ